MTSTHEDRLIALLQSKGVKARARAIGGTPGVMMWLETGNHEKIAVYQKVGFIAQVPNGDWWVGLSMLSAGTYRSYEAAAEYVIPHFLNANAYD